MLPAVKQQILGEAKDILKEALTCATLQAGLLVGFVNQVQNCVENECQKIEGQQMGNESFEN
ncbi:MAG: hypothetical protein ACYTXA_05725 [Nostoc sp.]